MGAPAGATGAEARARAIRAWWLSPRGAFAVWTALALVCGAWHDVCACGLRARADEAQRQACAPEPRICPSWGTVIRLAPRWLGDCTGAGGPLVTWAMLLPFARSAGRLPLLVDVLLWYLALIMPVRYFHLLMPAGWPRWDPSGHVFVYGAQLVPTGLALHAAAQLYRAARRPPCSVATAALGAAAAYSCALLYLSLMTASFFHTFSETLCALALVGVPLGAHHRVLGARSRWSSDDAGLFCTGLWVAEAAAMWALSARGALAGRAGPSEARLIAQCVYDGVLWAAYWTLQTKRSVRLASGLSAIPFDRAHGLRRRPRAEHEPAAAGGADSDQAHSAPAKRADAGGGGGGDSERLVQRE